MIFNYCEWSINCIIDKHGLYLMKHSYCTRLDWNTYYIESYEEQVPLVLLGTVAPFHRHDALTLVLLHMLNLFYQLLYMSKPFAGTSLAALSIL